MDIAPVKSQRDYRRVLKEIEGLMSARRNTPQGDRLDVLVTLVEAWERKHYPLDLPDPVEAIRYHMEQNGLQPRDLIPFIGSRNRVHEVLNRRRELTLHMIRRLHEGLGIPAKSLIKVGQSRRLDDHTAARVRFTSGGIASSTSAAIASSVGITCCRSLPRRRIETDASRLPSCRPPAAPGSSPANARGPCS